jgi:hypothetical protein
MQERAMVLVVSMILGMVGGLLGLMIEFGMLDRFGMKAPAPPVGEVDHILLFACALLCIIGGAIVTSRRTIGSMYWAEVGALLMLGAGTAMGIYLGLASLSSVPVLLTVVGALLAFVVVDKYPRLIQTEPEIHVG